MKELDLVDYTVYSKLTTLFEAQQIWRDKITKLLSTPVPELDALTAEMRSYRNRESGVALL
jgi:hypothetical protein